MLTSQQAAGCRRARKLDVSSLAEARAWAPGGLKTPETSVNQRASKPSLDAIRVLKLNISGTAGGILCGVFFLQHLYYYIIAILLLK